MKTVKLLTAISRPASLDELQHGLNPVHILIRNALEQLVQA